MSSSRHPLASADPTMALTSIIVLPGFLLIVPVLHGVAGEEQVDTSSSTCRVNSLRAAVLRSLALCTPTYKNE